MFDTKANNSVKHEVFGLGDLENEASNVLDGLTKPIHITSEEFPPSFHDGFWLVDETYHLPSSKFRSAGIAHRLFGELPRQPSLEKNAGNHGNKIYKELAQVIRTSILDAQLTRVYFQNNQTWIMIRSGLIWATYYSSRENLAYPALVLFKNAIFSMDIAGTFLFDPGICSWLHKGCGFTKPNGVEHNFDKLPNNLNVELWVDKVIIFVFDPGPCVIFVNILEDKDVLKGVGKRIVSMDTTLVIQDMKMIYYIADFLVDYSYVDKAFELLGFEVLWKQGIDGSSMKGLIVAFFGIILKKWGIEKLRDEVPDETPENTSMLTKQLPEQNNQIHSSNWIMGNNFLLPVSKCSYLLIVCEQIVPQMFFILHTSYHRLEEDNLVCEIISTANQLIMGFLFEGSLVCVIIFSKKQSVQWLTLLPAFVSRHGIPFSIILSGVESLYLDSLVHMQVLSWKLDKNVNIKVVFLEFVAMSLRDFGVSMSDICGDEAAAIHSVLESHQLSAWSGAIENILSFFGRHKLHGVVDEISDKLKDSPSKGISTRDMSMLILISIFEVGRDKYVLVPPCPVSGCFTVLIPCMLLSFQDIRLGNSVSFGATFGIESQLQKHFVNITCSFHIHWLDSWLACANLNIISKGVPYLTVVGFLGFLVTTVAGYFMEVIGNGCKISDGRVSNVNINILARQIVAKMEDFVWDPGLVWVSHFTALRTRRLLRGRICHVPRLKTRKKRSKKALVSWT